MADVHQSPEPQTVTVDTIPATEVAIVDRVDNHNKEVEMEVTNAPVTPDTEDKLPETKEDASTQPEGNVEDLKRKSEEMDVTLRKGTEKKLRLDSPIPEETQDERAKETAIAEVREVATAEVREAATAEATEAVTAEVKETATAEVREAATVEVMEAANADIPEVETLKENSKPKTPDAGADPPKLEAEMDNPKGEAEAAA